MEQLIAKRSDGKVAKITFDKVTPNAGRFTIMDIQLEGGDRNFPTVQWHKGDVISEDELLKWIDDNGTVFEAISSYFIGGSESSTDYKEESGVIDFRVAETIKFAKKAGKEKPYPEFEINLERKGKEIISKTLDPLTDDLEYEIGTPFEEGDELSISIVAPTYFSFEKDVPGSNKFNQKMKSGENKVLVEIFYVTDK